MAASLALSIELLLNSANLLHRQQQGVALIEVCLTNG